MNSLLRGFITNSLLLVACSAREEAPASVQKSSSVDAVPEIVFYVPPLVGSSRARFTATSEWSQNDDRDTIFVVLRGASSAHASIGLSIDAVVRRVSLADEAKNTPPKDTVGRHVEWQSRIPLKTDSLAKIGEGILLRVINPSSIDRSVPGVDAKADEQVVALQIKVTLPSGTQFARTVRLLPSV